MAILARLAFDTPVHLDQVLYEGIEHIAPDDLEYARELGLGLKLIGTAERVDGGLSVRVHPAFLYPAIRWRRVDGPFNAVTSSPTRSPRSRCPGPAPAARRRRARCSATSISAMIPPASTPADARRLAIVDGRRLRPSTCTSRWPTSPGVLAQVAQILGAAGRLGEVGRAEGPGRQGAARDGHAPGARVAASSPRVELIAALDFLRAAPRAIRVIEEEFV